ncbi:hypothetical protein [Parabacteroides pacaensis]|uniref:hypothetical protein n=1 Tax=Parabacteroides pacaensis TaxID=2086575 RepID=UPI000D10C6B3|nr:hypothetical protein [Parabacteroides pacaensis]
MNRIFIITFATISMMMSLVGYAQKDDSEKKHFNREAFLAKRNAFIIAEVGLTPQEAEKFIPLCNELQDKKFELGRECRKLSREMFKKKDPTDAEYAKIVDDFLNLRIEEAKLDKVYFEKFKKILSPEKLFKYQMAEGKFARNFMRGGPKGEKEEFKK